MKKVTGQIKRAKIYISENIINRNSWSRALCFIILDLVLILGLLWHIKVTGEDWTYWEKAPNAFNVFLLMQYSLIISCIRFPLTTLFK